MGKDAHNVAQTASSAVSQAAGLPGQPIESKRVIYQLRTTGVREFEDPRRNGVHSRGYLPHVKREGSIYFVTFRLAESLPREILLQYKREWSEELRSTRVWITRQPKIFGGKLNDTLIPLQEHASSTILRSPR